MSDFDHDDLKPPALLNIIGQDTVRICADRYKQYLANTHGPLPPKVVELFGLQRQGGMCPYCGRYWAEISLKNRFADYTYYKPDCPCYKPCPGIDQIFTYGQNPVKRHTVKKTCGHPSFIEQELFSRMECEGCHIEIETWKSYEGQDQQPAKSNQRKYSG